MVGAVRAPVLNGNPLADLRVNALRMKLLERERDLATLAAALETASSGEGRIVLVSGEAGVGKTSFVEHFAASDARAARVLKGHCDPLFTPSPLAPLHDIARHLKSELLTSQIENGAGQQAVFSCFLELLQDSARPVVLVFEDIHWADAATLDLVKFL